VFEAVVVSVVVVTLLEHIGVVTFWELSWHGIELEVGNRLNSEVVVLVFCNIDDELSWCETLLVAQQPSDLDPQMEITAMLEVITTPITRTAITKLVLPCLPRPSNA